MPETPDFTAPEPVSAPAENVPAFDAKAFLATQEARVNDLVYGAVAHFGGSFSAEHGVGALKTEELAHYQSPVALSMMRAVKQALDPQNLLNPGRVLGLAAGRAAPAAAEN